MREPADCSEAPRAPRRRWIVLAITAGLIVLGGAGYLWYARARAARARDAHAQRVAQHRADLAAVERCLESGMPGDLVAAIVLRARPVRQPDEPPCRDGMRAFASSVLETAAARGAARPMELAWVPYLGDPDDVEALDRLCAWLRTAHAALDDLAGVPGGSPAAACDTRGRPLPLVEAPDALGLREGSLPVMKVGRDVVVLDRKRDTTTAARTTDGKAWEVRTMPQYFPVYWEDLVWTDEIFATVVIDEEPHQLYVDERGAWEKRARLPVWGILSIQATEGGLSVVTGQGKDSEVQNVLHSTDGGRRFSPPVRAIDATGLDVAVWVLPDQAVLTFAASKQGPARFQVARHERGAARPVVLASLAWQDGGEDHRALGLCDGGDTYWALVRRRHLVVSRDRGRSWREVADLEVALERPRLTCAGTQLAIQSRAPVGERGYHLRVCDPAACGPRLDAPIGLGDLTAVQLGDRPELWIAKDAKDLVRRGKRFAVAVYRFEAAALAPDRLYIAGGGLDALPIVRTGGGFLHLREH